MAGHPRSRIRFSRKSEQHASLLTLVKATGGSVMPCSYCAQRGPVCKMIERVSQCSACVRRGRTCDGSGVSSSSAFHLIEEKRRLEREEATEASLLLLQQQSKLWQQQMNSWQQQMSESIAQLACLCRQKRAIVLRSHELVRRGLKSLDELEGEERRESETMINDQAFSILDAIDWNAISSADFSFSTLTGEDVPDVNPSASMDASGWYCRSFARQFVR